MIREVIQLIEKEEKAVIRSNVNKTNTASLTTHKKCGFVIEKENGINYILGTERENVYGMLYKTKEII